MTRMISADKVVEVARKYAEKHSLCSVVDEALMEMGALEGQTVEVVLRFDNVPSGSVSEFKDSALFEVYVESLAKYLEPTSFVVNGEEVTGADGVVWCRKGLRLKAHVRSDVYNHYSKCGYYLGNNESSPVAHDVSESDKCKNCAN